MKVIDSKLKSHIILIEDRMKKDLEIIRERFKQSTDKGYWVEHIFREFLRMYLPGNHTIGHGEVIDSTGETSNQTDIVITNEYHPRMNSRDMPGIYFIEGVCAAGEVKTTLTDSKKEGLPKILKDSLRFKILDMKLTSRKNTIISTNTSDKQRFYKYPPWFVIAFDSKNTLKTLHRKITQFVNDRNIYPTMLVDAIFILNRGWIINLGDGFGSFKWKTPTGKVQSGWIYNDAKMGSVLYTFLLWLLIVMPKTIQWENMLIRYFLPPMQIESL